MPWSRPVELRLTGAFGAGGCRLLRSVLRLSVVGGSRGAVCDRVESVLWY